MAGKFSEDPKGRLTLRVTPETHRDLQMVALAFGLDLTGLLNQIIGETLPAYMVRASLAIAEKDASRQLIEDAKEFFKQLHKGKKS